VIQLLHHGVGYLLGHQALVDGVRQHLKQAFRQLGVAVQRGRHGG
jgi:hypothetical protein